MSDGSSQAPHPDLCSVWEGVAKQGYALTTDRVINLPEKFRENFQQAYFSEGKLRNDAGDLPRDRKRARDVIFYAWNGDDPKLEEYETIAIRDRAGIKGERIHKRVYILDDPEAKNLVCALLKLVPPTRRKAFGTFSINLFRTYTDVVTEPHKDLEEFVILYVLHRDGKGAETYLYRDAPDSSADSADITKPVLERQLNPGDLIIFEDKKFFHGATPLTDPLGGKAMRDVLVCTVDYPTTYLQREFVS